jgi:hypothetical protein
VVGLLRKRKTMCAVKAQKKDADPGFIDLCLLFKPISFGRVSNGKPLLP